MLKHIYRFIIQLIDGALYGFIGPFCVLYIIPQFLMKLVKIKTEDGFGIPGWNNYYVVRDCISHLVCNVDVFIWKRYFSRYFSA